MRWSSGKFKRDRFDPAKSGVSGRDAEDAATRPITDPLEWNAGSGSCVDPGKSQWAWQMVNNQLIFAVIRCSCVAVVGLVWFASAMAADWSLQTAELQVRLARAHASPGPVDGLMAMNTRRAIEAFQRLSGLEPTGDLNEATRDRLGSGAGNPPFIDYKINKEDINGPFIERVPDTFKEMAELDALSYTSPVELLAEKFAMDEDFLQALNPGKDFSSAGTSIKVADLAGLTLEADVKRIEVDKREETVSVFDTEGKLMAVFPSTVGSEETPSPSGEHIVKGVATDPTYTYDPKTLDFSGVDSERKLTILLARTTRSEIPGSTLMLRATAFTARRNQAGSDAKLPMGACGSRTGTRGSSVRS